MTNLKRLGWLVALATLVVTVVPRTALAASPGISLTTSPVSLNLNIKPGTSSTSTLQLMNNGSEPLKINMKLDEFNARGQNGQALITEPSPSDPTVSWVSFSPGSFTAPPGVWMPVKMTINLPKTAQLGYYYAVIFSPDIPATPTHNSTVIKGSNGILVLIDTQSGNEKRLVNIANFNVSKKVYEYLPATFNVSVHNSGNIYLAPFGNIYISRNSNFTNSIAALDVNRAGGNVLPNSSRNFTATWSDGFPVFEKKTIDGQVVSDKQGTPIQQLKWNTNHLDKLRFGKYYAKLTLIYNDGKITIPITSVVSFWVLPWKLISVFIALILFIIIVGWFGRKRLHRAFRVLMGKE
jgi:hypothetical protein